MSSPLSDRGNYSGVIEYAGVRGAGLTRASAMCGHSALNSSGGLMVLLAPVIEFVFDAGRLTVLIILYSSSACKCVPCPCIARPVMYVSDILPVAAVNTAHSPLLLTTSQTEVGLMQA